MNIIFAFKRKLFTFLGDIKVSGWMRPMWFTINAHGYKLRGAAYRGLRDLLQPGDIVLCRYDGYLSSYMIPGFWIHAGLYIGDDGENKEQVVHSVSEGVIQEDILNFMRTDHMVVLRLISDNRMAAENAIKKAKLIVGCPYDFGFDFKNTDRFSCTELVAYCYPGIVTSKKKFGREIIIADDIFNSDKLNIVWNSQNEDIQLQQMGVVKSFLAQKSNLSKIVWQNDSVIGCRQTKNH